MTTDSFSAFGKYISNNYEIHDFRHGVTILKHDFSKEFNDIKNCLENFSLTKNDILKKGGGMTDISKRLTRDFYKKGWKETTFNLELNIKANKESDIKKFPTHGIDSFKNKVGVEVEWNNKTEFYDRDLGNFRLLNELKILDLGIIITRCDSLQEIFNKLGKGASYGSSTTILSKCVHKAESGRAGACPLILFGIKKTLVKNL